ncbi:hypothetical protein [Flavobacterium limi]|uniref:Lipoprotein n=1 Tax=Flavobacterium limi TaxID=2045105 RepID=A0ABQ1TPK3_9FLAO|nr:hypothetical protein [Flavobacterium limi]GGF00533.1 hypothetical protein GCM10011518_07390 [Flavobacterium limi]
MKTYFYLLFIAAFTACSKKNPIEKALQTNPDEYWCYYYNYKNETYYTYYKFKDDQLSYRYNKDRDGNFTDTPEDPYVSELPEKWSASEDSILTWRNFSYDVVSYNDKAIILTYPTKEKPYTNYLFLIKEKEGDLKKYPGDYDEKRLYNPEKYKSNN